MTAENLTRTVREVPMERVYTQVDWTALIARRAAMRAAFEAGYGVPLTYMPFILRGMVIAARAQPRVNSRWAAEGPEVVSALNIGVAVSTDAGLQVPVVHHAEDWSLVGLARALHRIIPAAREGRLTINDIQGGTITVTNPGPFGTVRSAPIIPPGQSAILSVDSVREVPVVVDGATNDPLRRHPRPHLRRPPLRRERRRPLPYHAPSVSGRRLPRGGEIIKFSALCLDICPDT